MRLALTDYLSTCLPTRRAGGFIIVATAVCLALVVSGCASLPTGFAKPDSTAFRPNGIGDSALQKVVEASRPSDDLSGFRLLSTGAYAFNTRVALARRAQHSLDVQYYIIHDDETGHALLHELEAAAARGVRVRLLVDDIGTENQDQLLLHMATQQNISVRIFNPFAWARSTVSTRILTSLGDLKRINHRMHNKSFVADNVMAVTGGRNIGNEYFMHSTDSNFIDLDVFAVGPVVNELSNVFDRYWNSDYVYPIGALVKYDKITADLAAENVLASNMSTMVMMDGLAATVKKDVLGYGPLSEEIDTGKVDLLWASARVVADLPSKVMGVTDETAPNTASGMLMSLMTTAQSEMILVSPYFVPGKAGIESMKKLRDRGVDITVLTNSLAATDTPIVHTGYSRYRLAMLKMGIHLYELSPNRREKIGMLDLLKRSRAKLHAKIAVLDHQQLFVGSINLDARSARENTEQGLIIRSPKLAEQVLSLLDANKMDSAYRLRLAASGEQIEWIDTEDGKEVIYDDEPNAGFFLKFGLKLLAPIAPEELL
jgi:putative cardiolipin synthase